MFACTMIMNTPSPHNITLSAVARRFSLVWLMLLLGTLSIFAQSASDFSVTVVSTPSTCVQNGKVEIKVSKVPGAPTNYTYKAYYDLLNSKETSVTTPQGYVANNVVANLYPGTYTALVRIEVQETGLKIDLPPKKATITSTYKNPTVKVREVRKSLNNYRPNGSSAPVPTGILSVTVLDGNGPYTLTIEAAPTAYKGKKEFSLEKGKELFLYEVPAGQYRLKVSDACGVAPVQTLEMTNVRRDLPNSNISSDNVPFHYYFKMTSDMRLNQCGWMQLLYARTSSSTTEPDLNPYFNDKDTLARYYDYAWQTKSDWAANKPRVYHEFQKTAPFGSTNHGSDKDGIYYKLPDGVTYKMMRQSSNLYKPLAFIRVKGSSEELPEGYSATHYHPAITQSQQIRTDLDVEFQKKSDLCSPTYVLQVRPWTDYDVLLCFPIIVQVVSKTNPNDKQELTLTEDVSKYTDFPIPLKHSESYSLTTIGGNGQTTTETIEATRWTYKFSHFSEGDFCTGKATYHLYIERAYYGFVCRIQVAICVSTSRLYTSRGSPCRRGGVYDT